MIHLNWGNTSKPGTMSLVEYDDIRMDIPLPIEMSSFESRNLDCGKSLLEWTTTTKVWNKGFEIQRSKDGLMFESVGFVQPVNPRNNGNRYSSYTE